MEITLEKVHKRLLRIQNYLYNNNGETWNSISLDAGWTATIPCQYMMLPNGVVLLRGSATHASFGSGTLNVNGSGALPAAYQPTGTRYPRTGDHEQVWPAIQMATNGVIICRASGTTSIYGIAILDGFYTI